MKCRGIKFLSTDELSTRHAMFGRHKCVWNATESRKYTERSVRRTPKEEILQTACIYPIRAIMDPLFWRSYDPRKKLLVPKKRELFQATKDWNAERRIRWDAVARWALTRSAVKDVETHPKGV